MGYEHERRSRLVADLHEQVQHLRLHHHVERRRRLVRQQHSRVAGERHRDRGPLSHAARELVREAACARGRNADELEQLTCALVRCAAAGDPVQLHRLGDLLTDGLDRVERVHRTLKHHRDVTPAVRRDRALAMLEDVLAVEQHAPREARGWRQQAHQREDRGRLAAAGLAHEAEPLTGSERERDSLDRVQLALVWQVEPDVQVLDLEHVISRHPAALPGGGERGSAAPRGGPS